jgi:hypothetical protein
MCPEYYNHYNIITISYLAWGMMLARLIINAIIIITAR